MLTFNSDVILHNPRALSAIPTHSSTMKNEKDRKTMNNEIHFGDLTLNVDTRNITNKQGNKIYLRHHLFSVLCLLSKSAGQPIPRKDIVNACWGNETVPTQALTNVIYCLRNVFVRLRASNIKIVTIPRYGYTLFVIPNANEAGYVTIETPLKTSPIESVQNVPVNKL